MVADGYLQIRRCAADAAAAAAAGSAGLGRTMEPSTCAKQGHAGRLSRRLTAVGADGAAWVQLGHPTHAMPAAALLVRSG